jgi:hypothetical protein
MVRLRCAIRAGGGCGVVQPVHRMGYGLEFRPSGALVGGHGQTPAVSIMVAVVHAGGEGDDRVGGSGMDSCLSCCFRQSRRGGCWQKPGCRRLCCPGSGGRRCVRDCDGRFPVALDVCGECGSDGCRTDGRGCEFAGVIRREVARYLAAVGTFFTHCQSHDSQHSQCKHSA